MNIDVGDIERISNLIGIEIKPEELGKYEKELAMVLEWVNKLDNADISKIDNIHDDTISTPLRKDEVVKSEMNKEIVKAFPSSEKNMAKVKKVI